MNDAFAGMTRFGHVHHLALNTPANLDTALADAASHSALQHVLEGDVCWTLEGGNPLFYFRHPRAVFDRLSAAQVRARRERGTILLLDDVPEPAANVHYIFELKIGAGDTMAAVRVLTHLLVERFAGRFWVDSFATSLLAEVKRTDPRVATSLHTELACRRRLLAAAPYPTVLGLPSIAELAMADAIAIRCHFGQRITRRGCAGVRAAGKALILSRLFTPRDLAFAREMGAVAGYLHAPFDSIAA